jgi:hypothetical protein
VYRDEYGFSFRRLMLFEANQRKVGDRNDGG